VIGQALDTNPTAFADAADTHDVNGDGFSDVACRDTSGDVALWFMNGTPFPSFAFFGAVPTNWSIVGAPPLSGTCWTVSFTGRPVNSLGNGIVASP
jgi:hypothetical protein